MKLNALRLHGFKSFADSTEIEFHEGITAVVGPNGCGKSNISDAIRWALGEQRPTAIRGARMEEAIFQGTVSRRPVNRASVSLLVSNEDGSLPVPFEEVELGRTVYRDGGSEYSINRSSCRLRDVLDLCRDTGLGANAYAIIENRMIDAILSDRAEERRGLFEEAAGIGKYKDRRKAALRRLERADLDLQRLDDVIGEVESKVRALARQKGKAQRHQTLRDRRLAVEVAVVRHQLGTLRSRLDQVEKELVGDRELGEGYLAELRGAETQYETLRLRQVEVEKARREAAQRADQIRQELIRWERELAVAEERTSYAGKRLAQIGQESVEIKGRVERLGNEVEALRATEQGMASELEGLLKERGRREGAAKEARGALELVRQTLGSSESNLRDLTRRQAHLEGEATSAEAQGAELARHMERLKGEMEEASHALSVVGSQGDLFADEVSRLLEGVRERTEALERAKDGNRRGRVVFEEARKVETVASDRVTNLEARIEALEGVDRSQEGLEPAMQAALELGDSDILGTLGDALSGDPEVVRAVESYLGPLVQGLVVRDGATVRRLREWHRESWGGGGGLILLPLDRISSKDERGEGSLLGALELQGPGVPWVRRILAGVALEVDPTISETGTERGLLSLSGTAVDGLGVVRIGSPLGSSGILERRERVKLLKRELKDARRQAEEFGTLREVAETEAGEAEMELELAWQLLREGEDAHRSASAQVQSQTDKRVRLDRHQEELARQIEGTRASRARALDRAKTALEDRELLQEEADRLRVEENLGRQRVAEAQGAWEQARARESELALEVARKEGDRSRLIDRIEDMETALEDARGRFSALEKEDVELKAEVASAKKLREEGAAATETLFRQRDEAEGTLGQREEAADRLSEALQEADRKVRSARTAEREALDRRHTQELEQQELVGRIGRIQDRLEGEWGKPLEVLLAEAEPVEGEAEGLKEELLDIVQKLEAIGLVNMLAVEEHQEESARLEFLLEQREDLKGARDDLRAAIRQINETATQLFRDTFGEIQENFQNTFQRLFEGGEATLWLEDEDDPLESTIEIHASPRGKRTQRIDLLSGGERALTALSLLFGIYLVKPSPFCVLDEVDAPLDESNIYRFIRLLQEFKDQTQFIVITHNARTIEAADWIYGVTMEEPGVSRIVGVQLEDALQTSGSVA
ncbi:MAG: chromosome segregation protein SMC [Gemmatimonadota bacterium]